MSGLSPRQVSKILKKRFPEANRETRQAIEIIFGHLVSRRPLVHLSPPLDYPVFVDLSLTTRCLVCLVCEDLRAGGNAPIYVRMMPIEGRAGGDEDWIEIISQEWPRRR